MFVKYCDGLLFECVIGRIVTLMGFGRTGSACVLGVKFLVFAKLTFS